VVVSTVCQIGVTQATGRLLGELQARTALRTREGEREKARARGARREALLRQPMEQQERQRR
jgi:hypothetical protein